MADYNALQIPTSAHEKGGIEVLRAAVIEGVLHVTLRRAFNDPQAWGILLADVGRQVARVYAEETDRSEEETISMIRNAFETAMNAVANSGSVNPIS